ncbi:15649_t:CDS:10 [Funneliformis mosseae]|uniref:15649_t:CDS:1 n=1 Tax=Funneliformis mosseae TaxID=27381 RepID=A0A9N8VG10_FUNMO|nr:15649_t:CDS:10 [Funneliformis mosseae]
MYLSPECLNDLRYRVFWESTDEPSLNKFLNYRIHAEDLKDEVAEHNQYIGELNSISKYYPEMSEIGKKVKKFKQDFKEKLRVCVFVYVTLHELLCGLRVRRGKTACLSRRNDKNSQQINHFWDLQTKRQNIITEIKLLEERNKLIEKELESQINLEQTQQILDTARENRGQVSLLQRAITGKIEKRILDETQVSCKQPKRKIKVINGSETAHYSESNDVENDEEIRDLTEAKTTIRNEGNIDNDTSLSSKSTLSTYKEEETDGDEIQFNDSDDDFRARTQECFNKRPLSSEDELDSNKTKTDSTFNVSFDEYTTVPSGNDPKTLLPPKQGTLKRPLDIYEMDLDWAPWKFDAIINDIDIEQILLDLYKKCQKKRPKTKTSLDCGIIDLNEGVILEALGESTKMYFEEKIQRYKPRKVISEDVAKILKKFNVTSLEDLGKVLSEVKIDYKSLDRDIVYVHRLFQKFFELHEGWYNSHIVAPIFDDCLESVDEWILRRRQFEFIYIETATTSILSKTEGDLSKLHQAIILMFKLMVSTLPEKLLEEISSMPVLCVQFNGASIEIYLANWPINMRPIVFSIMEFDIPEEVTALPKLTKVAAKMLSLRSFILDLNKKYQVLLKKAANYYLDEDNVWDSPLKLKVRC